MSVRDNTGSQLDGGMHWETNNGLTMDASHARQRLQAYLSQMAALHPEQEHPDMAFVDALIEDRAVVRDHDNAGSQLDGGMHWETNNGLTMDASHARQRLQAYLSQMAALHPEQEHPDMAFVDALIEDRAVVRDHDTVHEL